MTATVPSILVVFVVYIDAGFDGLYALAVFGQTASRTRTTPCRCSRSSSSPRCCPAPTRNCSSRRVRSSRTLPRLQHPDASQETLVRYLPVRHARPRGSERRLRLPRTEHVDLHARPRLRLGRPRRGHRSDAHYVAVVERITAKGSVASRIVGMLPVIVWIQLSSILESSDS